MPSTVVQIGLLIEAKWSAGSTTESAPHEQRGPGQDQYSSNAKLQNDWLSGLG
jgi:hypothetical protein